jgi:hypothetical protein
MSTWIFNAKLFKALFIFPERAAKKSCIMVCEASKMINTHIASVEQSFLKTYDDALHHKIAVRAYYKAEQRGFAPGHALDDWLEAEAEILSEEAIAHLEPED